MFLKMRKILKFNSVPNKLFCTEAKTVIPSLVPSTPTKKISIPLSDIDKKQVDKIEISPTITDISAVQSTDIPKTEIIDRKKVIPFDEIPSPKILRYMSDIWRFLPTVGTHLTANTVQQLLGAGKLFGSQMGWLGGDWLYRKLLYTYGPIVRLHGPFGGNVIILSRPEHVETLFKNEGPYPIRSTLDCIEHYRLKYRQFPRSGPFTMYGPEWEQLRTSIEGPLNTSLLKYEDAVNKNCGDFLIRLAGIRNRQDEVSQSFTNELYKWSLECLCMIIFEKKLGFLDPCGVSPSSDPGRLLHRFFQATAAVRKLEYGPHLYKLFNSFGWKNLRKSTDVIDQILNKYIDRARDSLENRKTDLKLATDLTLLENLLAKDRLEVSDIQTLFMDMMLIGVNAVTFTISYLLYYLGKMPRCQIKLYKEIESQKTLNMATFAEMPYLQACIKECLRLKPPMPLLSRTLNNDVIINNYHIPRDTFVLIATHLISLNEEYFEDADKFKPERWLNDEMESMEKQLYISIPYGYGLKACFGKQMAQMQISYLLVKILQRFRVEYHYGPIESSFDKFLSPQKRPFRFTFIDRY